MDSSTTATLTVSRLYSTTPSPRLSVWQLSERPPTSIDYEHLCNDTGGPTEGADSESDGNEQHTTRQLETEYINDYVHNDCLMIVQSVVTVTYTYSILIWQTIHDMQPPDGDGDMRVRRGASETAHRRLLAERPTDEIKPN